MVFDNVDFCGNVKEEKFGCMWKNSNNEILTGLRNRKELLKEAIKQFTEHLDKKEACI